MKRIRQLLTHCISTLLFRVAVSGESCWPVLVPGGSYWASALLPVRTGDFMIFYNSGSHCEVFIKRVREVRTDGYKVESLISWGLPSEDIKIVDKKEVLGRLIGKSA